MPAVADTIFGDRSSPAQPVRTGRPGQRSHPPSLRRRRRRRPGQHLPPDRDADRALNLAEDAIARVEAYLCKPRSLGSVRRHRESDGRDGGEWVRGGGSLRKAPFSNIFDGGLAWGPPFLFGNPAARYPNPALCQLAPHPTKSNPFQSFHCSKLRIHTRQIKPVAIAFEGPQNPKTPSNY